ncbi:hypothetical protein P153DRAFT_399986 [Dothidotthia symphoricarpi CBS 119687]|uniref:Zn(2)-C6 fungal-type domain-containing protein n=1 Tax=Dothidotthia symphoricarpi CBS 119687 TaxID=1392245 RepID=A0A6A6A504_9PLEO|nr:uncharacterized protein P153DRAFT_399986 [Dothidotthia symphoricarpi CBS 119687]KAF2125848.1 hypothetical protein P153DRAFT_399986 [Dothidotthia symphoricarpi CBS 119687]
MVEHLPKVVVKDAVTDGYGPMKQRRRPARACLECRVRKVRCDCKRPCDGCVKTQSENCTYVSRQRVGTRSAFRERSAASPSAPVESYSHNHDDDQSNTDSAPSNPNVSDPTNQFELTINRYIAPGIFGVNGGPKLQPLPANRPVLNLRSHPDSGTSSMMRTMLDKISSLENEVAALKNGGHAKSRTVQTDEPDQSDPSHNPDASNEQVNKKSEDYDVIKKIKTMDYIVTKARISNIPISPEVRQSIPSKEICDMLVDCYFRTFEGVFRILHIPTFRTEYENYWAGIVPDEPSIIFKILLVCAIGVPFYTGCDRISLRRSCAKWVQAAAGWLSGPSPKLRRNTTGLQVQILLLLARQVCGIDGKDSWIPAGSVLRMAMFLGLYRDPSHLGITCALQSEMRRRLWTTVLEFTAQSSLDVGMPPMISTKDYDTRPPSNVNDEDIVADTDTPLHPKAQADFTESSIQIALAQTLPIRLEIMRLVNNLRFDMSYEDVLRHGADLAKNCRESTAKFKSALASHHNITPFQIKMADSLVRRFVLCLHRPYFAKALKYPRYLYSRKMCLDTSLALYAPAIEIMDGQEDDWTRMTHRCVGFFESFFLYAMSTIYIEFKSQIEDQRQSASLVAPLVSSPNSRCALIAAQFDTLHKVLESAHQTAVARLRNGEANAKSVVFLASALARIDAVINGVDDEHAGLEAARTSVKEAAHIIAEVYREEHGESIDLSPSHAPFEGHSNRKDTSSERVLGENDSTDTEITDGLEGTIYDASMGLEFDFGAPDDDLGTTDWHAFQNFTMDGGYGNQFDWGSVEQFSSNTWPVSGQFGLDTTGFR